MAFHKLEVGLSELVQKIIKHKERVVAGIDVPNHEARQLVFLPGRAPIEENQAARLEQRRELLEHALVIWEVLDHAHDDDRIELLLGLELVKVGELDLELAC